MERSRNLTQNYIRSAAWDKLARLTVQYKGVPCGIQAACTNAASPANYNQVFVRDFAVVGFAYLMRGDFALVRNFLVTLAELQPSEQTYKCFQPGQGLMPVSFVIDTSEGEEQLIPDYGDRAIGGVSPSDSGFWWLYLLRAYVKASGDTALAASEPIQRAVRLCIDLAVLKRFDIYPTVLVPDGAYMIDRRMGVHGYPIDVQAIYLAGLLSARELLPPDSEHALVVQDTIRDLRTYLRRYYWLDLESFNRIYRYQVEQYGGHVVNTFNINPESIPAWIQEWLPDTGGYFVGNVSPGRMDFRYFAMGNLLAILTGLAEEGDARKIMTLYAERADDLIGEMPAKLVYPPLVGESWREITGYDSKNWPWSYHNGGNWPVLLWMLAAAMVKSGCAGGLEALLERAGIRLAREDWPEYYDGHRGRLVGRKARRSQSWSIAGYLVADLLVANPDQLNLLAFDMSDVPDSDDMPKEVARNEDNLNGNNPADNAAP